MSYPHISKYRIRRNIQYDKIQQKLARSGACFEDLFCLAISSKDFHFSHPFDKTQAIIISLNPFGTTIRILVFEYNVLSRCTSPYRLHIVPIVLSLRIFDSCSKTVYFWNWWLSMLFNVYTDLRLKTFNTYRKYE